MDFSRLKKLESTGDKPAQTADDRVLTAIVKVSKADYCPQKAKVRSRLDSHLFTAEIKAIDLADLEADPLVETISLNRAIPLQKLPG